MEPLSLFDADLRPAVAADAAPGRRPPAEATPGRRPPDAPSAAERGPVLLALDGNSLAHRAFHAYGTDGLGGRGEDRGALYGFFALLAGICDVARADALVVGFDCRRASRRRDVYPGYKAHRPDKDPALPALLDLAAGVLEDVGVAVARPEGWEADDVLGSAAAVAEAAGWRCVLATSDRDAYALVSERTTVLRLRNGIANAEHVTPAWLRRRVGVSAEQYVEFAALRGDVSDNLPGIAGIGPARAGALLGAYATVDEAVADPIGCRSVLGRAVGQALIDDLADGETSVFRRNVGLMTVRRDLPVDLQACRRSCPADVVEERVRQWGLGAVAGRMALALAARPDVPPPPVPV